jgi:hypothetical protein
MLRVLGGKKLVSASVHLRVNDLIPRPMRRNTLVSDTTLGVLVILRVDDMDIPLREGY